MCPQSARCASGSRSARATKNNAWRRPGSRRSSCDDSAAMTVIRVALLANDHLRTGGVELVDEWKAGAAKMWVDIENPRQEDLEPLLETRFGFHELAAEDSLSEKTLPKYDRFIDYDFFIFRAADVNLREHGSQTFKLAAFLGRDFLFTVHREPMAAIDDVRERLPSDRRLIGNGPDFLLYNVVDEMVD